LGAKEKGQKSPAGIWQGFEIQIMTIASRKMAAIIIMTDSSAPVNPGGLA
jgi:hypothetical protein